MTKTPVGADNDVVDTGSRTGDTAVVENVNATPTESHGVPFGTAVEWVACLEDAHHRGRLTEEIVRRRHDGLIIVDLCRRRHKSMRSATSRSSKTREPVLPTHVISLRTAPETQKHDQTKIKIASAVDRWIQVHGYAQPHNVAPMILEGTVRTSA